MAAATEDATLSGVLCDGQETPLRTYSSRWHMLAMYMLLGLNNQVCWLTFSTVSAGAAGRYNVGENWITAQTTSVTVLFLPGAWLCSKVLAKTDHRRAVVLGAAFQALGSLIRWFGDAMVRPFSPQLAFGVIFLGQDIGALAAPAFMNTPAVLAEDWFMEAERETAMSAAVFSPIVGQGLGGAISGFLASGENGGGLGGVIAGQAISSVLLFLWSWCFFRSKPPTPPTRASHETSEDANVLVTWARLLLRPQYLLLLTIFIAGTAIAAAVLTLYAQLAGSCGYGPGVAGGASGIYILCGVVGALISGSTMGKTGAYRTCLHCTVAGAVLGGLSFLACLQPDGASRLLISTGFFGMMLMSCMPTLITNAVEETFPMPADACTTLLFIAANVLQIVVTPSLQAVHDMEPDKCGGMLAPSRLFIIGLAIFGCAIPAMLYRVHAVAAVAADELSLSVGSQARFPAGSNARQPGI